MPGRASRTRSLTAPPPRMSRRRGSDSPSPSRRQERGRDQDGCSAWRQLASVVQMVICLVIALMYSITMAYGLGNDLVRSRFLCDCSALFSCPLTPDDFRQVPLHLLSWLIMMAGISLVFCISIILLLDVASVGCVNLKKVISREMAMRIGMGCFLMLLFLHPNLLPEIKDVCFSQARGMWITHPFSEPAEPLSRSYAAQSISLFAIWFIVWIIILKLFMAVLFDVSGIF